MAQQKIQSDGFRAVQKVSVCEEIIEQVKTLVGNNHFGPGSRLPSERELAEHLSVSRPTLREALRTLAIMGVLQTQQGSGTQVADSSKDILKAPFEFLLILDQPSISEIIRDLRNDGGLSVRSSRQTAHLGGSRSHRAGVARYVRQHGEPICHE